MSNFDKKVTVKAIYKFKANNNDEVTTLVLGAALLQPRPKTPIFLFSSADVQEGGPDHSHPEGRWWLVGGDESRNWQNGMVSHQLRQGGGREQLPSL